ncbi:MAG: gliding motility-associated C-terminal domain-containing protein [Ferruginibacter sp.]|nr:gliding motility-associated C-terminal domain-containing protein [Ferruginibacter sp.]
MKNLLLLFSFFISGICNCQTTGCIDSVTFNQFYPSNFNAHVSTSSSGFKYTPQHDKFDNLYLSGSTYFGGLSSYWSILKFNANNQLVWYKNYKTDIFSAFKTGGEICDIDNNGNLVFSLLFHPSTIPSSPFSKWQLLSKTDNTGNLLWSKVIKHGANPSIIGFLNYSCINNNGEIFLAGNYDDYPKMPVVAALGNNGNLLWSKRYQHLNLPKFHLISTKLSVQNNNTIIMALQYFYNADTESDPNALHGIQLVKLNKADGSILQQQSFMNYTDAMGTIPYRSRLTKINFDVNSNRLLLVSERFDSGKYHYIFTLTDENFNILKSKCYAATSTILAITKITVSKKNIISLVSPENSTTILKYATFNDNLDVISQREIKLANLGFPNLNWQADLAYKQNGILNFQLSTFTSVFLTNYFYLFNHSPFYEKISPCLGNDTIFYQSVNIYTLPVTNPNISVAGTTALQLDAQVPDFPPVDFTLAKTELCKAISICDTIKLIGGSKYCKANPLASFKIVKNPLCIRKTYWQADTTSIKILNKTDTSLDVEFLRSYRGYLYAGFGGCNLKDSIYLEVYDVKPPVKLGKDTLLCPGNTITLHAGPGFKKYKWQNNDSTEYFNASLPGLYHVTVVDSCGNISTDSINISNSDTSLNIPAFQNICLTDTANIIFPPDINNITWNPTTNSVFNNNTLMLYPAQNTVYSITAQRQVNCPILKTTTITVKPCNKIVFIPNSFTPNNDGLNDIFKATSNWSLQFFNLTIYNRYGNKIFETNNIAQGWDGNFKNTKQPMGGYIYHCTYSFTSGQQQNIKGYFLLIK